MSTKNIKMGRYNLLKRIFYVISLTDEISTNNVFILSIRIGSDLSTNFVEIIEVRRKITSNC